jgi:hypothetical protein
MVKKIYNTFMILILCSFFVQCNQDDNGITEGEIYYDISYPCLEKNYESMLFLLPKKMVMSFKNNQFNNQFIFPTEGSSLGIINNCESKTVNLIFGLGNNKKYTTLDSNSIFYLLDDLPNYKIQNNENEKFNYLGLSCEKMKIKSLKNDSLYDIVTTKDIKIKNVNWCTPFNEIDDVLLEYSVLQYGMEMHFKASKFNSEIDNDITYEFKEDYIFLESKKYLSEIKTMLSIFKCNE